MPKLRRRFKRRPLPPRYGQAQIQSAIEKGDKNEQRFAEALQILIKEGEVYNFYQAEHLGELDKMGIDFFVFTSSSRGVPFQVKSSGEGKKNHYAAHGPRIRCVVVDPFITPEALAARIKDEIEEVILEELSNIFWK